jgi:hypothetical protein
MIYYKVAFETTNYLRLCIEHYLHMIPLRHDQQFAMPVLICFIFDYFVHTQYSDIPKNM